MGDQIVPQLPQARRFIVQNNDRVLSSDITYRHPATILNFTHSNITFDPNYMDLNQLTDQLNTLLTNINIFYNNYKLWIESYGSHYIIISNGRNSNQYKVTNEVFSLLGKIAARIKKEEAIFENWKGYILGLVGDLNVKMNEYNSLKFEYNNSFNFSLLHVSDAKQALNTNKKVSAINQHMKKVSNMERVINKMITQINVQYRNICNGIIDLKFNNKSGILILTRIEELLKSLIAKSSIFEDIYNSIASEIGGRIVHISSTEPQAIQVNLDQHSAMANLVPPERLTLEEITANLDFLKNTLLYTSNTKNQYADYFKQILNLYPNIEELQQTIEVIKRRTPNRIFNYFQDQVRDEEELYTNSVILENIIKNMNSYDKPLYETAYTALLQEYRETMENLNAANNANARQVPNNDDERMDDNN